MQKLLGFVVLVLIAGASASVAYYFTVDLPHIRRIELANQEQEKAARLSRQCRIDGMKFFNAFASDIEARDVIWADPEFHFSKKLNTCLIHIRYILETHVTGLSFQYNQVSDVYANRPLLYGHFARTVDSDSTVEKLLNAPDEDVPNYTSIRYFAEKAKLFSQ